MGPLLLDTNVLLDALLERAEWAHEAAVLLAAAERGDVKAVVSVHALTTLDYVARRAVGGVRSRNAVAQLLTFVQVVGPDTDDVKYALSLAIPDFEDALHMAAARRAGATHVVTRDARHFRNAPIPAVTPAAALALVHGA